MKQNTKSSLLLIAVLVCIFSITALFFVGANTTTQAEDNTLVNMPFDGDSVPEGWSDLVASVGGGWALLNTGYKSIPVDASKLYASNNYEVSFDIKTDEAYADDVFYFHFEGLDATNNGNIYFKANNNGTYWCISPSVEYHPIYNNSGDTVGGRDGSGVDLTQKHTVKFVHFDGYLELWIDGTCRAVSHLSNFGNNNYDTRTKIDEGTIGGFAIHCNANVRIANFVIKEAVGANTSFSATADEAKTDSSYVLPLTAQNLYKGNFRLEGKFDIVNPEATEYYPNITVYGLNNSTGLEKNGNHYGVSFQAKVIGTDVLPQIFAKKPDTSWASVEAEQATTCTAEDGVKFAIDVYGDNIKYYLNGNLVVSTSFTQLGIEKGHAQYIRIQSGWGGMAWTEISYNAFDAETGAIVSASADRVKKGEQVTFTAQLFGATAEETFNWYIDGAKQVESGLTLTTADLEAGKHVVKYASDSFTSAEVTVEVLKDMLTIVADKTELYKTDSITVTATLSGDFETDMPVWYVDGVAQTEQSDTLVLNGLSEGAHKVVYKNSTTSSNELTFTVLASELRLVTDKNNFTIDEQAVVTAETKGVADNAQYTWKVNNVEQTEKGSTFTVSFEGCKKGDVLFVTCSVDGMEADTTLNIYFDPLAEIKADKNYKTLNTVELKAGETYGNYACREDKDGNYLESVEANTGSWYTLSGAIPETMYFAVSFDFFVPANVTQTNYVYPGFTGLNKNYPQGFVEIAITVSSEGFSPYIKDQADNNRIYSVDDYGFGVDLSFNGTVAKKGDWNKVSYVVSGKYLAVYINDVQVYFVNYPNMMLPSSIGFNTYPDGGTGTPFVKFRNIVVSGIVEETPEVASVACAVSKTNANVGEKVTLTANVNPYNAGYTTVEWYVNDVKVDGANQLKFEFSADKAGEYKIYCKVDNIKSTVKTVTVTADNKDNEPEKKGCFGTVGVASLVTAGLVAACAVVLAKRKED